MAASKGWFNLEAAGGAIPDTQFFEGDSAFKFLGLTRTQRLYGFVGWCVPRHPPALRLLDTEADITNRVLRACIQSGRGLRAELAREHLPVPRLAR